MKNVRDRGPDYVPPTALWVKLTAPQAEYIAACAKARDISMTEVLKRLVDLISRDALVPSILDDDVA